MHLRALGEPEVEKFYQQGWHRRQTVQPSSSFLLENLRESKCPSSLPSLQVQAKNISNICVTWHVKSWTSFLWSLNRNIRRTVSDTRLNFLWGLRFQIRKTHVHVSVCLVSLRGLEWEECRSTFCAERKGRGLSTHYEGATNHPIFLFCEILPFTVGEGDKNSGKAMLGNAWLRMRSRVGYGKLHSRKIVRHCGHCEQYIQGWAK